MKPFVDAGPRTPGLMALAWVNLAVIFAVELAGLTAFGLWGAEAVSPTLGRWALAVALPVAAAVVWGLFCAPRAAVRLPRPAVGLLKVAILTAAVLALVGTDRPYAAVGLAVVACLTAVFARVLPGPTK